MIGLGGRWSGDERETMRALLTTSGLEVVDVAEPLAELLEQVRACLLAPDALRDAAYWCAAAGATRLLFTCDSVATCREAIACARPFDEVCGVLEDRDLQVARLQRLLRPYASGPRDTLTGLPSRAALKAAWHSWTLDSTDGMLDVVLVADLDRFISINDRFTHVVGDEVLRSVARALPGVPRADGVWRFAGDEFVLHARLPDVAAVELLAQRVREVIASVRVTPSEGAAPIEVTASIGWAVVEGSLEEALRRADMALEQAKAAGRDRVVGFHRAGAAP